MKCVEGLRALGYVLAVTDGNIDLQRTIPGPRTPEAVALIEELKQKKAEAMVYLAIAWPAESAENERKFRAGAPRLYPFLQKTVTTPLGRGTLVQVGPEYVRVALDSSPSLSTSIPWFDIRPDTVEAAPASKKLRARSKPETSAARRKPIWPGADEGERRCRDCGESILDAPAGIVMCIQCESATGIGEQE